MNCWRLIVLLFSCLSLSACASPPDPQVTARFIVAFQSAEIQEKANTQRDETLNQWKALTNSPIEFIRPFSGHSWVVSTTVSSKEAFIETLQSLSEVKYVEEDQVIQISPIERPSPPGVRVY